MINFILSVLLVLLGLIITLSVIMIAFYIFVWLFNIPITIKELKEELKKIRNGN